MDLERFLANTGVVAITASHDTYILTMLLSAKVKRHFDATSQAGESTFSDKNTLRSSSLIREALERQKVPGIEHRTSSSRSGGIPINDSTTSTFSSGSYFVAFNPL